VAEISDAVARGDYEVRAEDVADAIVRFHRRSPDTGEEDRLAPRR
jgi:anti-sigma28 factor (negative regulator of flagellin synthesis)